MKLRLDKFLADTGLLSRSEAARAAKLGQVQVNGEPERNAAVHIDPEQDEIRLKGELILYRKYTYIMMNKPAGVLSATEDGKAATVLELLDKPLRKIGLFPCGRLDKDTVGLLILTNDGELSHRLLSPRHHVPKEYRFETALPLADLDLLEKGIALDDGYVTRPCMIRPEGKNRGVITLSEGKYHQIKRMFEAVGNRIISLERIRFAGIPLDASLPRGAWRHLTPEEELKLKSSGNPASADEV